MNVVNVYLRRIDGALLAALLLMSLLQGCITVDCKEGCCGGPPTACNKANINTTWTVPAANGNTYKTTDGTAVPAGWTCSVGGTRCIIGAPGKCVIGQPNCKTWLTPVSGTSGTCDCNCPNAYP